MNMFGLINIGVLPLLLEAMTPAYAQHEREAKPPAQEHQPERQPGREPRQADPRNREQPSRERAPQAQRRGNPESQPPRSRPGGPERQTQGNLEPRRPSPMPRQEQPRRLTAPKAQRRATEHRTIWQQHRAGNWQAEHRTWQDRGGYKGYRIPEARYRGHFGPQFGFRMFSFPLMVVGGFPRFQYEGYWFRVLDPWPEYWSVGWYDEDDMYIEYFDGGYYLYNRRHPMDRIAISVQIR